MMSGWSAKEYTIDLCCPSKQTGFSFINFWRSMEDVLSNASKVMVDVEGGNNMMVLPLDQIMQNQSLRAATGTGGKMSSSMVDEITNRVIQQLTQGGSASRESR